MTNSLKKHSTLITAAFFIITLLLTITYAYNQQFRADEVDIFDRARAASYQNIITGNLPGEMNVAPLVYIVNKPVWNMLAYPTGKISEEGWYRVIFRTVSIVSTSAMLTLIFYFFLTRYSLAAAIFSMVVAVSSHPLWMFAIDAKTYALWSFLTTVELIAFLYLLKDGYTRNAWLIFSIFNILLVLDFHISIIYVVGLSAALWFVGIRRHWRDYILPIALPVAIIGSYFALSVQKNYLLFYFPEPAYKLVVAHFTYERLLILLAFAALLFYRPLNKLAVFKEEGKIFLLLAAVMILSSVIQIMYLLSRPGTHAELSTVVQLRYFMYLTPASIIAMTAMSVYLVRTFNNKRPIQLVVLLAIGGLVLLRCVQTFHKIVS